MKRALFYLFRLVFGAFLIIHGLRGLIDVSSSSKTFLNSSNLLEKRIFNTQEKHQHFKLLREYAVQVLEFENFAFIFGGLLVAFGFKLSKLVLTLALLIDAGFINNPYFYPNDKVLCNAARLLTIWGGVLSI